MFNKAHFGRIANFFINIALGIVLTIVGLSLSGHLTPVVFLQNFVVSMGVGYTICDLIPAPMWGQALANRLHITNKLARHLFATLIGGLVLITCISFFCQYVAVGSILFQVWPHAWPYLMLSGYLVLVIFIPVSTKLAELLTKE